MSQAEDTLTAGSVASRDSRERDTEHTLAHRPLSRDIPPEMIEPPEKREGSMPDVRRAACTAEVGPSVLSLPAENR